MSILSFFCKPNIFKATSKWFAAEKIPHTALTETTSTNELAKAEAFSISDLIKVYVADQQSAGRGRGQNSWSNPKPGQAMMLTYSFNVNGAPQPITAPLTGLAIYRAILETWPKAPLSVKAPNDLLLSGKKFCGILVETVQMGAQHRLLIGIGLNVFSSPADVPDATYLAEKVSVTTAKWSMFMKKLTMQLHWTAQGSQTAHLSDGERAALLAALNQNPNLQKNYVSLSPFGDLVTDTETHSWRSL